MENFDEQAKTAAEPEAEDAEVENTQAETSAEAAPEAEADETVDYGELERRDLSELKASFPELSELESITELKNPLRYGALRDLGLSPIEAYLASEGVSRRSRYNNRSHLLGSVPAESYGNYIGMTRAELDNAKEIFGDLSDSEIQRLYKKVTR